MVTRILLVLVLLAVMQPSVPVQASNESVAVVLHAVPRDVSATCTTPQDAGFECTQATVQVAPDVDLDVYVYLVGADSVAAAAIGFDWDPSWSVVTWRGGCSSNTVEAMIPTQSGDSYVAAFDCVDPSGSGLIPLGWFLATSGTAGSLFSVTRAAGPDGAAFVDCTIGVATQLDSTRWGSIGVSVPGVDGCNLVAGGWGGGGLIN